MGVEEWRNHSEEKPEGEYDIFSSDDVRHKADEVAWDGLKGRMRLH